MPNIHKDRVDLQQTEGWFLETAALLASALCSPNNNTENQITSFCTCSQGCFQKMIGKKTVQSRSYEKCLSVNASIPLIALGIKKCIAHVYVCNVFTDRNLWDVQHMPAMYNVRVQFKFYFPKLP